MGEIREVQYFVLPDPGKPYLLARVRWPDVCHAISPARPDWQNDPGLFDLPYDPGGTAVTLEEAVSIAAAWGARLPSEGAGRRSESSLVRRMPSDWSNLSPAERRAWSIDLVKPRKRAVAAGADSTHARGVAKSGSLLPRLQRRRAVTSVSVEPSELRRAELISDLADAYADTLHAERRSTPVREEEPAVGAGLIDLTDTTVIDLTDTTVIDLTDAREDSLARMEDA